MKNLAVLVSNKGTGTNLRAIINEGLSVALVVADREEAAGIQIAKEQDLKFEVIPFARPEDLDKDKYRDQYSLQIAEILNNNNIDFAILAGFNRILTRPYFKAFKGRTINIHPGAVPDQENEVFVYEGIELPWNQGMLTEKAVENFIGLGTATSTIHVVTEKADFGPVLKRVFVPVQKKR